MIYPKQECGDHFTFDVGKVDDTSSAFLEVGVEDFDKVLGSVAEQLLVYDEGCGVRTGVDRDSFSSVEPGNGQ